MSVWYGTSIVLWYGTSTGNDSRTPQIINRVINQVIVVQLFVHVKEIVLGAWYIKTYPLKASLNML